MILKILIINNINYLFLIISSNADTDMSTSPLVPASEFFLKRVFGLADFLYTTHFYIENGTITQKCANNATQLKRI